MHPPSDTNAFFLTPRRLAGRWGELEIGRFLLQRSFCFCRGENPKILFNAVARSAKILEILFSAGEFFTSWGLRKEGMRGKGSKAERKYAKLLAYVFKSGKVRKFSCRDGEQNPALEERGRHAHAHAQTGVRWPRS